MAGMSNESLEGRLLAHRQILAAIVAELSAREGGASAIEELFRSRETFQDGHEDPGAVPDPGLAIEAALSDEMRRVAEEAGRRSDG